MKHHFGTTEKVSLCVCHMRRMAKKKSENKCFKSFLHLGRTCHFYSPEKRQKIVRNYRAKNSFSVVRKRSIKEKLKFTCRIIVRRSRNVAAVCNYFSMCWVWRKIGCRERRVKFAGGRSKVMSREVVIFLF